MVSLNAQWTMSNWQVFLARNIKSKHLSVECANPMAIYQSMMQPRIRLPCIDEA